MNKMLKAARKIRNSAAAVATLGFVTVSTSHAALDAGISTAVTDTKADMAEAGSLVLGIVLVAASFRYIKRMF